MRQGCLEVANKTMTMVAGQILSPYGKGMSSRLEGQNNFEFDICWTAWMVMNDRYF